MQLNRTIPLFLKVYVGDDGFDGEPRFARVDLDQTFIDNIRRLQALCCDNHLAAAQTFDMPVWGSEGLRTECDRLDVSPYGWSYTCREKYTEISIETPVWSYGQMDRALQKIDSSTRYLDLELDSTILAEALRAFPCVKIEYDLDYTGGDYDGVGSFAYVPEAWIREDTVNVPASIQKAFERATGVDSMHIVSIYDYERYTLEGELIEEETEQSTSEEAAE